MTEIAALLARSSVRRALIVDDAYDQIPLSMDLAIDAGEWTHFFEDVRDEDVAILHELYPKYSALRADELQSDNGFVEALWRGAARMRPELLDPLLMRYRSASATDLAYLGALQASLVGFGLKCGAAGRNFRAASAEADLIVIDC